MEEEIATKVERLVGDSQLNPETKKWVLAWILPLIDKEIQSLLHSERQSILKLTKEKVASVKEHGIPEEMSGEYWQGFYNGQMTMSDYIATEIESKV